MKWNINLRDLVAEQVTFVPDCQKLSLGFESGGEKKKFASVYIYRRYLMLYIAIYWVSVYIIDYYL